MLIQERVSHPDTLLKLFVMIDDQLKQLSSALSHKQIKRDPRGQKARLSSSEVITILILGAWRGISDKAKLYHFIHTYHSREFPQLVSYSKFVESTNRFTHELKALLGLTIFAGRKAQGRYAVVFQDSTTVPVCKVARASQHKTFRRWARKSKTGMGWWYGFKLHLQCDQEGRICAAAFSAANVDDRRLLDSMTRWMEFGIVVGDKGYISQEKANELNSRNVQLLYGARKNMKRLASRFQLACLEARHRIEEVFEYLKCCFGMIRTTHRAEYALPIHLMVCLLSYSFYKQLTA